MLKYLRLHLRGAYTSSDLTKTNIDQNKNKTNKKQKANMRKAINAAKSAYLYLTGKGTFMVLALFFAILASSLTVISIYARSAQAATNSTINFQARVLTSGGAVVPDGNYSVEFKVYDAAGAGTNEWTETQNLAAKNGYITASLGSVTPFPGTIDWSQEHWLTLNVNGDGEMGPTRMKVTGVPYSFRSGQADSLTNGTGIISASQLAQLAPGSVQGVSSANAALRINQTGAGSLLQLQSAGVDKFTVSNTGDTAVGGSLAVANGITVGNSTSTTAGTIRWTGTVFEGYNGSTWTSLGGTALGNPIINKVKLVTEIQNSTVNATATLQNDDELFFAIGANETWTFRFMVQGNANATPDYKFAVTAPGGATCNVSTADHEAAVSVANLGCGVSTGLVTGNTTNDLYEIIGTVTNGANAGNVQLQWAQNTANAANSTIYAGSSVLATRAVGANGTTQAFIQNGNSFGAIAYLGTNDSNDLNLITNSTTRLTVSASGTVNVANNLTVGTGITVTAGGIDNTNGGITNAGAISGAGDITGSGALTLASGGVGDLTLDSASGVVVLADSTLRKAGSGTTALELNDVANTTFSIINTDVTAVANVDIEGLATAGSFSGSGSGITALNASNISSGTVNDLRLSGNVTLLGNTFNGANNLVQLDGAAALPALNASNLTSLNASNISSGTINDLRLSSNVTLKGNSFNGNDQLVLLDATGALPVLNGSALTTLNASNLSSGTVNDLRLSSNVTLKGNSFNGNSQLVLLDATGALPALNAGALTSLNATNIASGTVDDARLSSNVTLMSNSFNGSNQLLQLDATGALPALNAGALTSLNATSISGGTLADGRLSTNVGLRNLAQSYTALQTFEANIVLGKDTATAQAGLITFNDATVGNGFTSVLGTNTLTANRAIDLPNEDGTLCIRNSTACGFIMLATGTAQVDSTTNASIFINKTGASGNIMTLQNNGTTTFSILNSGALQLQLTDASAFAVNDAGGTQFFNIDTSAGIVQIGESTADTNATLLVLDTKNTAGDPTGVDGASYYNSILGAMRCYENGQWKNCIDETNVVKTADQTVTNNATFQNGTNQAFSMAANSSYTIDASINYTGTSAAADFKYTFTAPAGAVVYLNTDAATSVNSNTVCNIAASGQTCTVLIAANFRGTIRVTGYVRTAGTAGNLQFQFAQNNGTAGQSVTVYQGSMLAYRKTQ